MASLLTELEKQIKAYEREFMQYMSASFEASKRNDNERQLLWLDAALQSAAKGRQARREVAKLTEPQCDGACTRAKRKPRFIKGVGQPPRAGSLPRHL